MATLLQKERSEKEQKVHYLEVFSSFLFLRLKRFCFNIDKRGAAQWSLMDLFTFCIFKVSQERNTYTGNNSKPINNYDLFKLKLRVGESAF